MTAAKYLKLMKRLVDRDYYDFSKGLPPRGKKHVFNILYDKLYEEVAKAGRFIPTASSARRAPEQTSSGRRVSMYLRKLIRAKWELATTTCTGQGDKSAEQIAAQSGEGGWGRGAVSSPEKEGKHNRFNMEIIIIVN
ncbi:MAG: hypothetical protein SGPRY_014235 [Prymnesium sp.]